MASIVHCHQVLGKKVNVLLADTNTDSLHHWKEQLDLHSYEVTTLSSGLAALEVLAHNKKKVDILLADVDLPDRNGLFLVQDAIKLGLPTILMTHREDFVTQKRGLENGACFCIGKSLAEKQVESLWQYVFLKERLSQEQHGINIGCGKRQRSENDGVSDQSGESSKSVKRTRRPRLKWTEELCGKLMAAIGKFGPGVNFCWTPAPLLSAPLTTNDKRPSSSNHLPVETVLPILPLVKNFRSYWTLIVRLTLKRFFLTSNILPTENRKQSQEMWWLRMLNAIRKKEVRLRAVPACLRYEEIRRWFMCYTASC